MATITWKIFEVVDVGTDLVVLTLEEYSDDVLTGVQVISDPIHKDNDAQVFMNNMAKKVKDARIKDKAIQPFKDKIAPELTGFETSIGEPKKIAEAI